MNKTPKLRFKEFSGDWESKKIGQTLKIKHGKDQKKVQVENGIYPILATGGEIGRTNNSLYDKESVLIGRKGTIDRPMYMNTPFWTVDTLFYSEIKDGMYPKFIYYKFQNINWKKYCEASGVPSLSASTIEGIKYNIPSKEEQEKIASFFSLIDDKISLQSDKVEALKDYKKGMMQKIFSRELRFKDDEGRDYPEWEEGTVKDILSEHLYQVDKPLKAYWRLGLRSHGKGTFHEYVTDPSKISMDKLYVVKKNMLIVNITFAWEHAIAITNLEDEGKLVSHRFPTYDFNENALYDFYKYYILLPKFKYCLLNASPGGAGRNRVLNKKQFLEIDTPIPCIEEQKKISKILNHLDIKINKEQEKLDSLNEYKKGLLQQIFV
ncbi:restriction endonuclease subunit S [Paraclostridium sordellii]|uniref:restriction endonuclease subunit S n=1 Tax=Paraclostridium sordellii TaxID=1505 RepID=UPI0005E0B828|nr:restriction endonuclease subunit S [Paeniclostridium sordellii]CEP99581.1 type IC HsdS subunit [[Clostridium] sordellii] [Paeniclostridium sordellii]